MSDTLPPRLPPLPESEWDPRLDAVIGYLGPVLDIHRVLAHHPALLEAWAPLRRHVAQGGTLLPRHREIVVLRVAHRTGSRYEWHHHVARGRDAGLTDEEIEAIRRGPAGTWAEPEVALVMATDELFDGLSLSGATWSALAGHFSVDQILDLIVTAGVYLTLAMVISATGLDIET